jgi:hypothetical protein
VQLFEKNTNLWDMEVIMSLATGGVWKRGKRKELLGSGVYFMDGAPSDKLVNLRGILSKTSRCIDATSFAFDDTLAGVLSALVASFIISYELTPTDSGYDINVRFLGSSIPKHIMHFDMERVDFGFVRCSYLFERNVHTYVLRAFFDGPLAVAATADKFGPWAEEYCIYSPVGWESDQTVCGLEQEPPRASIFASPT